MQRGECMLQINEFFYRLQGKDMFVQKRHSHNEIELIHVVSGNGIVLKNDRTYPLVSQHIYVIDARNAHIVHPLPEDCSAYVRNKIVIDADSFEMFCSRLGIYDPISGMFDAPPVETADVPFVDQVFEKVCTLLKTGEPADKGFAHGYLLELLHWIHEQGRRVQPCQLNTVMQKMLDYISKCDGVTTLNEMSAALFMSKFYLCHVFKENTGYHLSEYISDKRYERAVRLLKSGNTGIDEIAAQCGYSAASSFIRFFKLKSGMSPAQFRKQSSALRTVQA